MDPLPNDDIPKVFNDFSAERVLTLVPIHLGLGFEVPGSHTPSFILQGFPKVYWIPGKPFLGSDFSWGRTFLGGGKGQLTLPPSKETFLGPPPRK